MLILVGGVENAHYYCTSATVSVSYSMLVKGCLAILPAYIR